MSEHNFEQKKNGRAQKNVSSRNLVIKIWKQAEANNILFGSTKSMEIYHKGKKGRISKILGSGYLAREKKEY